MDNKPEFPIELLDGCILHTDRLKADFNRIFGAKFIPNGATISVDIGTVSYGYDELEAKKNQALLNCAVSIHNDMNKRSNRPEQGIYSPD